MSSWEDIAYACAPDIEYVPLGLFWSTEWRAPEDGVVATVTGRDRLELLRKTDFTSTRALQNTSLYDLAEIVLQDAGLSSDEYAIDEALRDIVVPWAWLEPASHREALRAIAEAGMATVYVDRDGVVRIDGFFQIGNRNPQVRLYDEGDGEADWVSGVYNYWGDLAVSASKEPDHLLAYIGGDGDTGEAVIEWLHEGVVDLTDYDYLRFDWDFTLSGAPYDAVVMIWLYNPTTEEEVLLSVDEPFARRANEVDISALEGEWEVAVGIYVAALEPWTGGAALKVYGVRLLETVAIGPDQYFRSDNPLKYSDVANEVIVETQPLRPVDAAQEVYRSNEAVTVPAGQTVQMTVHYNERPVIEAAASLEGATNTVIQSETHYGWGAEIALSNPGGSDEDVTLVISGKPLKVLNRERAVARDEDSITDLDLLQFTLANPLIQTRAMAEWMATAMLAVLKDTRRDLELEWRGNPALGLGDRITVKGPRAGAGGGEFTVMKNELDWSGALRARLSGRCVKSPFESKWKEGGILT